MAKNGAKEMTFFEHLESLRVLLVRCSIILVLGCLIAGAFFPYFADILGYPLKRALANSPEALHGLVTTSPMGIFSVLLQVCFMGGMALALPWILYFVARFVAPGLSPEEKQVLLPCCVAVLVLFLIGASFSYFFVLPASLGVSISLNQTFGFELIWSAPEYYGLVVWMTLGIGLCFEFPLAVLVLIYLKILSVSKFKAMRRHMLVAILIAGALITPGGDPFSLAIISIPLYVLYEAAIWVGSRIEKKAATEETEAEEDIGEVDWPL